LFYRTSVCTSAWARHQHRCIFCGCKWDRYICTPAFTKTHAVFESAFKALNELLLAFLGAMFERPGKLSDYIKSPYVVSLWGPS
jgi:hypothetical protein